MKNKGIIITLIVLLSAAILFLSVLTYKMIKNDTTLSFSFGKLFNNAYKELSVDEEYTTLFKNYKINSEAADIYVKESTNNKVYIKIYSDKELTSVDENNDTLEIVVNDKNCKGFCIFNKISKIELYVPNTVEGVFNISSKYGDIDIDNFDNSVFEVSNDAGDLEVGKVAKITSKTSYGDIKINTAKEITINASVGDVRIDFVEDLTIKSNTGDVRVDSIKNKVDIKTDIGDIRISNLVINENSKIESGTGDIIVSSTNDIYVDAKTKIGEVKVNSKDRKSEIVLTITNNIGDIKVNY